MEGLLPLLIAIGASIALSLLKKKRPRNFPVSRKRSIKTVPRNRQKEKVFRMVRRSCSFWPAAWDSA